MNKDIWFMDKLIKFNAMRFAISEAYRVDEVKLIRDRAEAYRYAMIQAKQSPSMIRQAEEIKVRAERRAGELLKEQVRKKGERDDHIQISQAGIFEKPTLSEQGITLNQSSNWQRIASIPEEVFEKFIGKSKEITTSGAVKLAKKIEKKKKREVLVEIGNKIEIADSDIQLINSDFREVELTENSVDLILTDPPYPKEYLNLFEDLGKFSSKYLKENGSLLVMIPQFYLYEIMTELNKSLTYHWILAYLTGGGQSAWKPHSVKKVNTFWKPLLWYVKNEYNGKFIGDVCKSDQNDKQYDNWGQSVNGINNIIEKYVNPGDCVCDPFLGAGTTGVVAIKNKCSFIGIDNDNKKVAIAKKRIYDQKRM